MYKLRSARVVSRCVFPMQFSVRSHATVAPKNSGGARTAPPPMMQHSFASEGGPAQSSPPKTPIVVEVEERSTDVTAELARSHEGPLLVVCYAGSVPMSVEFADMVSSSSPRWGVPALMRVDVDRNPGLARSFRVSNVPTTFFVYAGKAVDAVTGSAPPEQFRRWYEDVASRAVPAVAQSDETLALLEQGWAALETGSIPDASALFARFMEEAPEGDPHAEALAGLATCALSEGSVDVASDLLKRIDGEFKAMKEHPRVVSLRAKIGLAGAGSRDQSAAQAEVEKLRQKHLADIENRQDHYDYAVALYNAAMVSKALDELLLLLKKDRYWNNSAAKDMLLKIFEAEGGNSNSLVSAARKRLNSIWLSG